MPIFTILASIGGAIKGAGIATAAAAVANPLAAAALGTSLVSGGFSAAASRSAGKAQEDELQRQGGARANCGNRS